MARPETISASDLTDRLAGVFRSKGYEGSSLSELSESAGLAKAALYHRCGDGKTAMAMAVLDAADARFERDVLAPLAATGSVESRLSAMVDGLARFYARGSNACLVELFSVAGTPDTLRRTFRRNLGISPGMYRNRFRTTGIDQ